MATKLTIRIAGNAGTVLVRDDETYYGLECTADFGADTEAIYDAIEVELAGGETRGTTHGVEWAVEVPDPEAAFDNATSPIYRTLDDGGWNMLNGMVREVSGGLKSHVGVDDADGYQWMSQAEVDRLRLVPKDEYQEPKDEPDPEPVEVEHVASHLYHRYPGQSEPQVTYLQLDPATRTLTADWDAEIGNAVPASVWHGLVRRYPLPSSYLTAGAINRLLDRVAPLAARVAAGWSKEWDGSNNVGRLTDDAEGAEVEIRELLRDADRAEDCFQVRDAAEWFRGSEAEVRERRRCDGREETLEWMAAHAAIDDVLIEGAAEYLDQIENQDLDEDEIAALRSEAAVAGDLDMVAVCDRAVRGDAEAMARCVQVWLDARARED